MSSSVDIDCARCRHGNSRDARFCSQCGAPLHMPPGPDGGYGGERRVASILFADVKDSTRAIADLDAETAKLKLAPLLNTMIAAVRAYGGNIVKIQGDGILASFGAMEPLEDHAMSACRAALQIKRKAGALPDPLAVRIGINSGELIVTHDRPGGPDVSGPVIHLASRLEQTAEPNTILISDSVFQETRAFSTCRPRGRLSLKGFDAPQETWELLDIQSNSRWEARAAQGLSPFTGRRDELRLLEAVLSDFMQSGLGHSICIVGDAGCGKSRLAHEAMALGIVQQCTIWEAHTEAAGRHSPYAAVRQLLRQWLGLGDQAPAASVDDRLHAAVEQFIEALGSHEFALRAILNVPPQGAPPESSDPQQRRADFARAFVAVCKVQARLRPLLILQEDIHWCDIESLNLLSALAEAIPGIGVCLIATTRPMSGAEQAPRFAHQVELSEFSENEVDEFLDATLGNHESVKAVKASLAKQTGGLPLFLDEAIRHLAARGNLAGSQGAYVWTGGDSDMHAPPNVQAMAAARISALAAPLHSAIVAASAIGRRFPLVLLAKVLGSDEEGARSTVRLVCREHILTLYGDDVGQECEFRHEFLREAAYGMLTRDSRRSYHRKILRAAEILFENRLSDWLGFLAHHAAQAELGNDTARYNRLAAERAVEASSYGAALTYCEQALAALATLPSTIENRTAIIDTKLLLRVAVGATSDFGPWLRHLSEAIEIAAEIGDIPRRTLATIHRTWALNFAGSAIDAVHSGENALQLAATLRIPESETLARFALGQAAYARGDYAKAAAVLTPAIDWLQAGRQTARIGTTGTTLVLCLMMRANAFASVGKFDHAAADLALMEAVVGSTQRVYDTVALDYGRGLLEVYRGNLPAAAEILRKGYDACRAAEINLFLPLIAGLLGATLVATGQIAEADDVLATAMRTAESVGHGVARTAIMVGQAATLLARKQPEEALRLAGEARSIARERGHRGVEVTAARIMAQSFIALDPNDLTRPADMLRAAIDLAEEIDSLPSLIGCLSLHGSLLLRHQRVAEGIGELQKAVHICDGLNLTAQSSRLLEAIETARRKH